MEHNSRLHQRKHNFKPRNTSRLYGNKSLVCRTILHYKKMNNILVSAEQIMSTWPQKNQRLFGKKLVHRTIHNYKKGTKL
jgi:hypothetical protein